MTDPKGTTTWSYDGTDAAGRIEHRGLPTGLSVSNSAGPAVTFTGAYDADGTLITQKLPGGITQTTSYDGAGEPVGLAYSGQVTTVNADGSTSVDPDGAWLAWSQDNDVTGPYGRLAGNQHRVGTHRTPAQIHRVRAGRR